MTLIKSISGIRGTIGGGTGDTLNPLDIVKFVTAYATFMRRSCGGKGSAAIVVGRDGRISGDMVRNVVCGTLLGCGFDVIDIGLASTPTTEMAVRMAGADGGIIITASHNPRQWNALKLLNSEGEFLDKAAGNEVLAIADAGDFCYADVDHLGAYRADDSYFSFAQDFINGTISYRQLNNAMYLGRLGQQFVLKSKKAFDRINFLGSETAESSEWYAKKMLRDKTARREYFNVERNRRQRGDLYITQIMDEEMMPDDPRLR